VKLLANPVFVRIALLLAGSLAAFVLGIFGLRAVRRKLVEEDSLPETLGTDDASYAYSAVIQKLKQQKFELQNEHAIEKRRAKTSEHVTTAVIANLPCGVLFIAPNGLVRQANAAARQLLGFASPLGMSPQELFRDTRAVSDLGESIRLADAFKRCLHERLRMTVKAAYMAAGGEQRNLSLILISLAGHSDETLGLACVIADDTAVARLKEAQLLRTEVSAEMALELRTSLAIIRECATRIRSTGDATSTACLANDIAVESDRLEKVVGGFLAQNSASRAATAGA
jgi:nitrogen fixation/metabolism regulation signal transduction histidine kinase